MLRFILHCNDYFLLNSVGSLLYYIFGYYAPLVQKSQPQRSIHFLNSIQFTFWLFGTLLIIQNFNSVLLSNILYTPIINVNSMDDVLYRSSQHNVLVKKSSFEYLKSLLCDSTIDKLPQVCKVAKTDLKIELDQILSGRHIYVMNSNHFEPIINSNPNYPFHLGADQYYGNYYSIVYSKLLPDRIKSRLYWLAKSIYELGLFHYWVNSHALKVNGTNIFNQHKDDNSFTQIDLKSFVGIIYIFILVISFSLIIFIWEMIIKWANFKSEIVVKELKVKELHAMNNLHNRILYEKNLFYSLHRNP